MQKAVVTSVTVMETGVKVRDWKYLALSRDGAYGKFHLHFFTVFVSA
jgi:hypothetical protein